MASREFDAVILGATGVTGKQVALQFKRLGITGKWAIAGRSQDKLEALNSELQVPTIIADVSDPNSLEGMASRARLVLNATGPYRFFGEPVVKACIKVKTDYIDLCGEPEFMERMLLEHFEAAANAGVIVCHACAFDSVPADMGILHCAQLFRKAGGECATVELFHSFDAPQGYTAHDTTFQAAVHGVGAVSEVRRLRQGIDAKFGRVPEGCRALGPLPKRGQVSSEARLQKYALPFIGADASVVRSSRRVMANVLKQPDCEKLMPQFGIYFAVEYKSSLLKVLTAGAVFQFLAGYESGRNFLTAHPGLFTFGTFSQAGPTPEQMANNRWIGDFFAAGLVGDERRSLRLRGTMEDPGYIGTALMFSVVAETILQDRKSLSASGGVFTPAALFANSSLLDRLAKRGFSFEVVESDLPGAAAK